MGSPFAHGARVAALIVYAASNMTEAAVAWSHTTPPRRNYTDFRLYLRFDSAGCIEICASDREKRIRTLKKGVAASGRTDRSAFQKVLIL